MSRRRNNRTTAHRDTKAYLSQCSSVGLSVSSFKIVDRFVKGVYWANLNSKVSYCLPYVPDSFSLVGIPLWKPSTLGNPTVTNFTSSDFSSLGLIGGTNKRIETGWIPSSQLSGNTSGHICAYCTVGGVAAFGGTNFYVNGCEQSGSQSFHFYKWASNGFRGAIFSGSNPAVLNDTTWDGFILANALSGTTTMQRESGTGTITTSGTRPGIQVWLHGRNSDGNYDFHRYGFWSMGEGFTTGETSVYQDLVTTMQRRFGRSIN